MKRWKPKEGEYFYYVDDYFSVWGDFWRDVIFQENRFLAGNCFRTEKQAQEFAKRIRKLAREYHREVGE
mgnify:FL=1